MNLEEIHNKNIEYIYIYSPFECDIVQEISYLYFKDGKINTALYTYLDYKYLYYLL